MRRILFAFSAVAIAACNDPGADDIRVLTPPPFSAADWDLQVVADRDAAAAGEPVTFTVRLLDHHGADVTAEHEIRTQIVPAVGVLPDGGGVYRFTFADHYTYFAAVDVFGTTLVGADSVDVSAGAGANLDVSVDLPIVEAGQPVHVTSVVTDLYGNPAEGDVQLSVAPDATVQGEEIVSEQAGRFDVTGTLAGTEITDTDSFTVVASAPYTLEISLSSYDVEKGDGLTVYADVRDRFGNVSDIVPDLSTTPAAGTSAWGSFVRFDDEGIFTVNASIPEYSLSDSDGPVLVDSTGPNIRVTTPDRGIEIPSANGPTVLVSGSVTDPWTGVASLTVNGQAVSLQAGGLFSTNVTPQQGLNELLIVATDGDGNVSDVYQTYLWGEFNPMGTAQPDGVLARLNEGAIDTIETMAESMFVPQDLVAGLINQPLWSNSQQTCINIWPFGTQCVTWWSLSAGVTAATVGNMTIDLDAQNGYLDFFGSVAPFSVSGGIWGQLFPSISWLRVNINLGLTASASAAQIWSDVSLWVDAANTIQVGLANTSVALPGFSLSIYGGGILGDVLNIVLGWLSPLFETLMESVLPPVIESLLPDVIEDALADIEIAMSMDLLGATLDIAALPQDIDVDPNGMTITLATEVATTPGASVPSTYGAWRRSDYTLPSYPLTPDFDLSLADNFVNQLLHAVWQAGVMNFAFDSTTLGLDLSAVQDFLPLSTIEIETVPLLPPVVGPSSGTGLLELSLGDMLVNVYGDPGGNYGLMMQLAVSIAADADLTVDANNLIEFGVGTPVVNMSFVTSDWPELNGEVAEDLMESVVDLIVPQLTSVLSGIGGIPIPELPGFTLGTPTVIREPSPAYYITAGGNLVVLP